MGSTPIGPMFRDLSLRFRCFVKARPAEHDGRETSAAGGGGPPEQDAFVVQLDRARACGARGPRFESSRAHFFSMRAHVPRFGEPVSKTGWGRFDSCCACVSGKVNALVEEL